VFSGFLVKELTSSNNVKDKINRLSIQRLLRILQSHFLVHQTLPPNGLCCFVGIDVFDRELVTIFEPVLMVTSFTYSCGRCFDYESVVKAFETASDDVYVATVTGEEARIYSWSNNIFTLKHTINGLLIKRHKKGGQSSVRFSRLADESRHVYASKIIDKLNTLKTCLVMGSNEILTHISSLPTTCKIRTITVVITQDYITVNKKYILQLLVEEVGDDEAKIVADLIDRDPDMLVFGQDINPIECEYIITIHKTDYDNKYIYLPVTSKYYGKLYRFERIGKLYFKQ